ncbi:PAS domain S-box protein [Carboxylicivirga mesophila]|uniref:histidine kinase n=1 Tax=Carboxylicivirga mesophila TaxID=1166478 RepID=A0ABS5K3Z3_9BACT|nr:ATP-binding protein [Carboxylicivirga mesophila]MBS2209771.1 PAS domain S-box protein [Carboxylicivirga mesophila]
MAADKEILRRLELRIKELEEENNSLSDQVEEMLLINLINESFDEITDEGRLLTAVLEKISVLKDIPYCACFEFSETSYNCLAQYCSFYTNEPCLSTVSISGELLKELNTQSIFRTNLIQNPGLVTFDSKSAFHPGEMLAITFQTRALNHGVFIFVCDGKPSGPLKNDLLPFYQIIRIVTDKWDRISLMKELRQLNKELEKRVEERTNLFKQSEEKYRQLFDMATDAIFLWEIDNKGKVLGCKEMNDAVLKMTGYNKDDLQSLNLFSLLADTYTPKERKVFEKDFARQSGILEASFNTRIGLIPLELHFRRIKLDNKQMVLAIARDVSERQAYEKQIIEAKNKAVESEKLKSAFLANMSHEIRTPMNAIIGFSELLYQDESMPGEVKLYADIIFKNSLHLLNLINDIVDYSKIEAEQVTICNEAINVNELISELSINMISILHQLSKSHIDVLTHTPLIDSEAVIINDKTRLRQVFTNLINNAIKFTQQGFIEIGYQYNNQDYLEFYVRDSGIGIATENQKKVFERFVQVRDAKTSSAGGTGLGLAICSNLVERMNGQLCLESSIGEGSTFWFKLPYNKTNES